MTWEELFILKLFKAEYDNTKNDLGYCFEHLLHQFVLRANIGYTTNSTTGVNAEKTVMEYADCK